MSWPTSPHDVDVGCQLAADGAQVLRAGDGGDGTGGAVLRRAEQELRPPQVLVHLVRHRHLSVIEMDDSTS